MSLSNIETGGHFAADYYKEEAHRLEREVKELRDHCEAMEVEHRQAIEAMQAAEADKARLSEANRELHRRAQAAEGKLQRAEHAAREQIDILTSLATKLGHWPVGLSRAKTAMEQWIDAALSGSGSGWRAMAKPLDAWHEDDGFVTWWTWRDGQWLGEPSYIGSPLCSDWPGYHTHWTKHPDFPAAPQQGGE